MYPPGPQVRTWYIIQHCREHRKIYSARPQRRSGLPPSARHSSPRPRPHIRPAINIPEVVSLQESDLYHSPTPSTKARQAARPLKA